MKHATYKKINDFFLIRLDDSTMIVLPLYSRMMQDLPTSYPAPKNINKNTRLRFVNKRLSSFYRLDK